jgi:hypothetical protein
MGSDIDRARAETQGVYNRLHFYSAGAALIAVHVLHAMKGRLTRKPKSAGMSREQRQTCN